METKTKFPMGDMKADSFNVMFRNIFGAALLSLAAAVIWEVPGGIATLIYLVMFGSLDVKSRISELFEQNQVIIQRQLQQDQDPK